MRQPRIVVFIAALMLFCQTSAPASAQDECAQIVKVVWHPTDDLFALSCDTVIYIYTSEFELITTLAAPPEPAGTFPRIIALKWSPDGHYLAAVVMRADAPAGDGSATRLVIWDIDTSLLILSIPDGAEPIAWSPDSTMIASDSLFRSNGVAFYEVATGSEVARCIPCGVREYMAWNPVDMHQFLASSNLNPVFFDPMSPKLPPEVLPEVPRTYIVLSNGYHPDGSRFTAYNHDEEQIEVRDAYTRDILATLSFDETGWISSYHWLADGIYIETTTDEVFRWDGVSEHAEILFSDEWRSYYWKPDGSMFVSVNQTGVFVYETLTGDLKSQLLYEATATPTPQP